MDFDDRLWYLPALETTSPFLPFLPVDSLSELKRKFKDVLRAYWRQHKSSHEGEDTDQYDVAHRIATSIFNLYWDKPNYAGLRPEKKEILNYFVKHIQLSKSREGQSSNPLLRAGLHGTAERSQPPPPGLVFCLPSPLAPLIMLFRMTLTPILLDDAQNPPTDVAACG